MGIPSLTINTANSAGVAQSTFNTGSNVYLTATGLTNALTYLDSTTYTAYVVPHQADWVVGNPIPTPISTTTITPNSVGYVAPTSIYSNAALGQYDVIVKTVNVNDGILDSQDLLLTNVVSTPGSAFVVPEYAIGALGALATCFAVFVAYNAVKKNIGFPRFSKHTSA
jgi:hypothetical protein